MLKANNGIYKGNNPDNYIKINNKLWRIISLNKDGSIKIVSNDKIDSTAWDTNGQTNFKTSSINTYLNKTLYNNLNNLELKKTTFCLTYNQNECQQTINMTIGLLTTKDFLNASNNLKCQTGQEIECQNGNYLSEFSIKNGPEYTLNTIDNNVYIISNGQIKTSSPTITQNIRPVITLHNTTKIIGGSGTKENPYLINEV